ncbi:MAG: hypothetical protein J7494_09625 [Sphingobium sp.]|nr:hypothetical protein [Sphingobium sp.]
MTNKRYWSVDELAARKLLAELKLGESDGLVDQIAQHFAEHRVNIAAWAADRIQAELVQMLEGASASSFAHHGEDWARGFNAAEELVVTTSAANLLDIAPARARSKGQILRTLVRQTRKS